MKKFNDRTFRKVFTSLTTMATMLMVVLIIHLFFDEPLNSFRLWVGALIPYIALNLISDIDGMRKKFFVLVTTIVIMILFLQHVLHWSLAYSLYGGGIIAFLSLLLYLTFII